MTKNRKYLVTLTEEERQQLLDLLACGKAAGRLYTRAHILLLADESEASDPKIARVLRVTRATVARTRLRFVDGGVERALHDRPRPGAPRRLDDNGEQFVVALATDAPPPGHPEWTMQLLADTAVEFGLVTALSDETVRRTLKKTLCNPGASKSG